MVRKTLRMKLVILKTDIQTVQKVRALSPVFDRHPGILMWSVDTEDVDKVLRIEAVDELSECDVAQLIQPWGVHCEALPD